MNKLKTKEIILCSMFAGLSAILSQISIPIGPVPINLALISTLIAAALLGAKYGALSQIIFVLLGAIGLPVFAGFMGGIGRLFGPTGGFIAAYIVCAFVSGAIIKRFGTSKKVFVVASYAGLFIVYIFGALWYTYITNTLFLATLNVCVVPFIPGDAIKIIISAYIVERLRPILVSATKQNTSID